MLIQLKESTRYYAISIPLGILSWLILALLNINFVNIIFFILAYIWHFSLLAPNVKEYAFTKRNKLSLLSTVVRINFYLQMFINVPKFKFTSSFVRAISPILFTLVLFIVGGNGNLIFTFLGSMTFEIIYLKFINKVIVHKDDLEIPPAIPNEENSRE